MWFAVDKEGLARLLERRGSKAFALAELLQNAWDAPGTALVDLDIQPIPGRPLAEIRVSDDSPEGFKNLSHSFTLFADSEKKQNPTARGRFNLGEKLVLALCEEASVASTTGTVTFTREGRVEHPRRKLAAGTEFRAVIRMTRDEIAEALAAVRTFIAPPGIVTTLNGERLAERKPLRSFEWTLPTEIAGADGAMRRAVRKTTIAVYRPPEGMPGRLYEMGIPIVETGGDWFDVDIGQKIPLPLDRDSVTPAYLRSVRAGVLSHAADLVPKEESAGAWIDDALDDKNVAPEAVRTIVTSRFGEKVVTYDPSDREANDMAVAKGYTVLHGGSFSKDAWANVRASGIALPAGQVTPTPKPFDPEGRPAKHVEQTPGMRRFAEFCRAFAREVIGGDIAVSFLEHFNATAAYGSRSLSFNVGALGEGWFEGPLREEQVDLLVHELGHEFESNHLSRGYNDALTRLGAKATMLALSHPHVFDLDGYGYDASPRP